MFIISNGGKPEKDFIEETIRGVKSKERKDRRERSLLHKTVIALKEIVVNQIHSEGQC